MSQKVETTSEQWLLQSRTLLMRGGCLSFTLICVVHDAVFPDGSVAVVTRTCSPTEKFVLLYDIIKGLPAQARCKANWQGVKYDLSWSGGTDTHTAHNTSSWAEPELSCVATGSGDSIANDWLVSVMRSRRDWQRTKGGSLSLTVIVKKHVAMLSFLKQPDPE